MIPTRRHTPLVGQSASIRQINEEIDCAADSDAKVLITGETGVGKEVVAGLIHQRSRRSSSRMVSLNCAGVPDSLLESEFFGHVRGSFTGAYRDKPGLLEAAPNGTVFLDEIGEMSTRMQAVLLRFLETGEIQRVGADRAHTRVDVRLIVATNRDLQAGIAKGIFREDLFFRLNVLPIHVPPLRDRPDDIPLLVDHFLKELTRVHRTSAVVGMSDVAMDALCRFTWPGNVRQLKNVIERVVLKARGPEVARNELPTEVVGTAADPVADARAKVPGQLAPVPAQELAALMMEHGESFWQVVYPAFMSRDMTRADLRRLIQIGLEQTNGNYRLLVELFNVPSGDYKRFLSFLRKHDCHLPFQPFRVVPARLRQPDPAPKAQAK